METLFPTLDFGLPMRLPSFWDVNFHNSAHLLAASAQPEVHPTAAELRGAVGLLDMNNDGRIWEQDLHMLMELAFGVELSSECTADCREDCMDCTEGNDWQESAASSWDALKSTWALPDGQLDMNLVMNAISTGAVHGFVSKLSGPLCSGSSRQKCPSKNVGQNLAPYSDLSSYLIAFNRFDGDHNGVICARDLRRAIRENSGVELALEECKDIIRKIDTNYDGVVELNEFGALVQCLNRN